MWGTRRLRAAALMTTVAYLGALVSPIPTAGAAHTPPRLLRERIESLVGIADGLERELQASRETGLDAPIDLAGASLSTGRLYLDQASVLVTQAGAIAPAEFWIDMAEFSLREGRLLLSPSRSVEARGILLDSDAIPKTLPEVRTLVAQLAAARFNMLLPEVIRRGYAIYPTRWLERDAEFSKSPDIFGELVREAHRLGIEVHPWVWALRVRSYDATTDYGNPVLSRLPALAARSSTSTRPRFLSPASPGARDFILRTLGDLLDRYDVDGLFLDYIRYDEETPDDWISQTNYRLERMGPTDPWGTIDAQDYQLWREAQVNRLVADVSTLLKNRPRPLMLSAATFRGESYNRKTKMQNWRHWANNAWLDYATSMLYSEEAKDLDAWISQETDAGRLPSLFYPILGVHRMGDPAKMLIEQIRVVRHHAQPGFLVFALGHLPKSLLADLSRGPFRTRATPPHQNPLGSARHLLNEMSNQLLGHVASTADWPTVALARIMKPEIVSVARTLPGNGNLYLGKALLERLASLEEIATSHERASPGFQNEMRRRLKFVAALVKAHVHKVSTTRFVPPQAPVPAAESTSQRLNRPTSGSRNPMASQGR